MTDTATDLPKLLTDEPATNDLLGFTPHAKRLAALIQDQIPNKASFVIGIEGEWGEGKSSFINLLKTAFPTEETDEARPTIVDFNPWWFEGSDQLLRHFFDELLGQIDWTRGDGEKLFDSFSKLAAFAGRVGKLMQLAPEPMLQTAGKVAEGVGQALGGGSKPESFRKLREDAAATLSALSFKTIVFIDDLDRLPAREIVELFRVIKAVADLPNIVYVIAYDRAIVASALEDVYKRDGEAYLEKIIQYPYMLPKPHSAQYHQYVIGVLAKALNVSPSGLADQSVRMIIDAFFPVPRSVKRLSAALLYFGDSSAGYVDMDPLDYLFLESIRYYDRDLFFELISALLSATSFPDVYHKADVDMWVADRFAISAIRYKENKKIVDCINCFAGIRISAAVKPGSYQCQARGIFGISLGITTSVEDKQKLAKFVRAYLAKHRDQDEVSKYEVNALASVKSKDAFSDYVRNFDANKLKDLFWAVEHYKSNWGDRVDVLTFSRAWIGFIRDGLLSGEDAICGISFSNLFGSYLRVFGGLMEHRVEEGSDGTVLFDVFNDFFDIGGDDIFWSVIFLVSYWAGRDYMFSKNVISQDMILNSSLGEKDVSVMLSVGIFRDVFMQIKLYVPDALCVWLASLECSSLSNQKSIIKLSEFIMRVELEVQEVEALRKNHSFVTLLRKYQEQLVEMFEQPEHHARYARLVEEA